MNHQQSISLSRLNINSLPLNISEREENISLSNPFAKKQKEMPSISEITSEKENYGVEESSELFFKESDYLFSTKVHKISRSPESLIPKISPNKYIVEKSLKTMVIFESNIALIHWKKKMSDPRYVIEAMKDPSCDNILFYYRYPDVSLPMNQKKNIHKALLNSSKKTIPNDENLSWYRMFSEKWRLALLSVFDTFKLGLVNYFYFIQENLTILFERDVSDSSMKAQLQLTSLALAEDLKNNGIFLFYNL